MRPASQWQNNLQSKRGGRRVRKKKEEADQSAAAIPEALTQASGGSSPFPMDDADDIQTVDMEKPDGVGLPPTTRPRSLSAHMPPLPALNRCKSDGTVDPAAFAALQRAIRSSPGKLGTKHSPIDLDDQTPQPTRRTLFPSPNKSQTHENGGDPTTPRSKPSAPSAPVSGQSDKENQGPNPSGPHALERLFSDFPALHQQNRRSTSPADVSPASNPFKTPTKQSSQKRDFSTTDFFSSAAKAFLHGPRTPSHTPSKQSQALQPLGEMTPFTRHLNQIMSEHGVGDSPSKILGDLSGAANHHASSGDFDFGTFDSEGVMPSSPPLAGWFGVCEDLAEEDGAEIGGWNSLGLGSSPFKDAYAEEKDAGVDTEDEEGDEANAEPEPVSVTAGS
jgi:hypothetical protein